MKRLVFAAIVTAIAITCASADYVTLDPNAAGGGWEPVGGGYYDFHYIYYRESPLAIGSTWSLHGAGFVYATGPVYWNITDPVINENGSVVVWTYDGGDDPQNANYTTFDVTAYMPGGSPGEIPYYINDEYIGTVTGPTPEPGTLLLALAGLGAIGAKLRRRTD